MTYLMIAHSARMDPRPGPWRSELSVLAKMPSCSACPRLTKSLWTEA
jgi:hypothetical protein